MLRYFTIFVLGLVLCVNNLHSEDTALSVTVLAVLASQTKEEIEKPLVKIAEEARKKDPTLKGFELNRKTVISIPMGETKKIPLAGDYFVEVTINAKPDADGKVTMTIKPPKMDQITYSCLCDRFVCVVTDVTIGKNKERLIVAIMAKPCTLKK